jgi:hypothetical protein
MGGISPHKRDQAARALHIVLIRLAQPDQQGLLLDVDAVQDARQAPGQDDQQADPVAQDDARAARLCVSFVTDWAGRKSPLSSPGLRRRGGRPGREF